MSELDDLTLVTKPAEEQLNQRQHIDYQSQRTDCLRWLLHFGKKPDQVEGYAFETVRARASRMDMFYRWVWKQFIEEAANAELDGLATLFCMTTIQIAYRVDQLEEKQLGLWTNHLANIRLEHDPQIVDTDFASLKEGVQPESSQIRVQSITYDPSEPDQRLFERLFSGSKTDEEQFENWLEEFQQRVHERTEYIRES